VKKIISNLLFFEKKKLFAIFLFFTFFVAIVESLSLLLVSSYFVSEGFIYNQIQKFNISKDEILILILFFFIFKFFLLNFFSWSKNWFINQFTMRNSNSLFKIYLNQKLIFYTSNRSSDFIRDIWYSVKNLTTAYDLLLKFLSEFLVFIILILILLMFNLKLTLIILIASILVSSFFIFFFKKKLETLGGKKNIEVSNSLNYFQEAFNFIREVKVFSLDNFYLKKIDLNHRVLHKINTKAAFISEIPKNSFELFIVFILFFLFYFSNILQIQLLKIDDSYFIFLVISSYRLIPSFLRIIGFFNSLSNLKFDIQSLVKILKKNVSSFSKKKINFSKSIEFKNISFEYKNQNKVLFNNLNLSIKKNKKYFLKGESGLGKSTLVDIISGLSEPKSGKITVDNKNTSLSALDWFKKISYMSQNNTLFSGSVLENIVLHDFPKNIDLKRLGYALKTSNSLNFVNKLSKKLDYFVGEKGKRLSSGQVQRIILARCLYKKSDILILDEFLSSLDEKNSNKILKLISKIRNKTIFIILHKYKKLNFVDYEIDLNQKLIKVKKI